MNWSKYQNNIFYHIENEDCNIIVEAVAGSGKSTTILEATKLIPEDDKSVFSAFNSPIAANLRKKLADMNVLTEARTLHSLGRGTFWWNTGGNPELDTDKLNHIIESELEKEGLDEDKNMKAFIRGIIPKIKAHLCPITLKDIFELQDYYNMGHDVYLVEVQMIQRILDRCKEMTSVIDFDDMIWIPLVSKFRFKKYDWILIDEVQDLNFSQFELVKQLCNGNTRIIAVGDSRQSIYAFRGADVNSMKNFKEYFNAKELSLPICYRCPTSVISIAKTIVPEIEPWEKAPHGLVKDIHFHDGMEMLTDKDLVLCRCNAPLVSMAFDLIRDDKKVIVKGRDIGRNLIKMVQKYKVNDLPTLRSRIQDYRFLQTKHIVEMDSGKFDSRRKPQLMELIDRCDTILAIAENVDTIKELIVKIDTIFDEKTEGITCSSVHKAKGLENGRVFILNYHSMMPLSYATRREERQQEMNIKYVAVTRAKEELYFMEDGKSCEM